MNFLKDSLLHLREFRLGAGAGAVSGVGAAQIDERVIAFGDRVQVRGNLHRMLPTSFSSPLSVAFVASAGNCERTNFFLCVGGMKLPVLHSMTLHPNLDVASEDDHDCCLSLNTRDGKQVVVKLPSAEMFQEWHHFFCEAMAELIFTQAFTFTPTGALSAQRLEVAMRRATRLVPTANCHWLRAKRLWNIKIELAEILRRLDQDIHSVSRDHVRNFIANSEIDRLLMEDGDFLRLKSVEASLTWAVDLHFMPGDDFQNVSLGDPCNRSAPTVVALAPHPARVVCSPNFSRLLRSLPGTPHSLPALPFPAGVPTIEEDEDGHVFEESDVHWQLCSPDRTLTVRKPNQSFSLPPTLREEPSDLVESECSFSFRRIDATYVSTPSRLDQGTSTADLFQHCGPGRSGSSPDVYQQIDEMIVLLQEFESQAAPGSREGPEEETDGLMSMDMSGVHTLTTPLRSFSQSPPSPRTSELFSHIDGALGRLVDEANTASPSTAALLATPSPSPSSPHTSGASSPFDAAQALGRSFPSFNSPARHPEPSPIAKVNCSALPSPLGCHDSSFLQPPSPLKENCENRRQLFPDESWLSGDFPKAADSRPIATSPTRALATTPPNKVASARSPRKVASRDRTCAEDRDLALVESAEDVMLSADKRRSRTRGSSSSVSPLRVLAAQQHEAERLGSPSARSTWRWALLALLVAFLAVVGHQAPVALSLLTQRNPQAAVPSSPSEVVDALLVPQSKAWTALRAAPNLLEEAAATVCIEDPKSFAIVPDTAVWASAVEAGAPTAEVQIASQATRLRTALRGIQTRASPLAQSAAAAAKGALKCAIRAATLMPRKHQEVLLDW